MLPRVSPTLVTPLIYCPIPFEIQFTEYGFPVSDAERKLSEKRHQRMKLTERVMTKVLRNMKIFLKILHNINITNFLYASLRVIRHTLVLGIVCLFYKYSISVTTQ